MKKILRNIIFLIFPLNIFSQTLVADLTGNPSDGIGIFNDLVVANNLLFFAGTDGNGDRELYYSDGTVGNATKVGINPSGSSNPSEFQVIGNEVFFLADNGNDGWEWHKSDGTTTTMLETEAGLDGILSNQVTSLLEVNGDLYFVANTDQNGTELWKIPAGSTSPQLLEFQPGTQGVACHFMNFQLVENWEIYNELAYEPVTGAIYWMGFGATVPESNIWKYDIGSAAPVMLPTVFGGINEYILTPFNGKVYFTAYGLNSGFDYELWECDGTNVQLAFDIAPSSGIYSFPTFFSPIGSRLYFTAYNEATNQHEVAYLEASGSTVNVQWEAGVPGYSYLSSFPQNNPFGYDAGDLLISSDMVYRFDNSSHTWSPEHHFRNKALASKDYIFANGHFFYWAWGGYLAQVFYHDGSANSTPVQVSNFTGECDCPLPPFRMLNGKIYFPAYDQSTGLELYMLDPVATPVVESETGGSPVSIYPNPVNGEINIEFKKPLNNPSTIKIVNTQGQLVFYKNTNADVSSFKINSSTYAAGIYFLEINRGDGNVYRNKIIKR